MEWRPHPHRPNYHVSNTGLVRKGERILRIRRNKGGYMMANVPETRYIHQLVAETFLGEKPEGMEVNHIDHDKANNTTINLEWVTHAENIRKRFTHYAQVRQNQ